MSSDSLAELCQAALARCEARAQAVRATGPLALVLDAPCVPACVESIAAYVPSMPAKRAKRASGVDTYSRRVVDWSAYCERETRRYGVVSIDGATNPDGVAYMLRLVESGLYEHDQGSDEPYSGSNSFRLLDYGYLADTCGLRACAPDCSNTHYYELGHALYRQAVRAYGVADKRAKRLDRFANPSPNGADMARACAGRASGKRTNYSGDALKTLQQARADSLALGSN